MVENYKYEKMPPSRGRTVIAIICYVLMGIVGVILAYVLLRNQYRHGRGWIYHGKEWIYRLRRPDLETGQQGTVSSRDTNNHCALTSTPGPANTSPNDTSFGSDNKLIHNTADFEPHFNNHGSALEQSHQISGAQKSQILADEATIQVLGKIATVSRHNDSTVSGISLEAKPKRKRAFNVG
ncbi:hypothetical protein BS50DRAFT_584829 [Corynespora cassiicola Philippines]|uniref:Uncharacterized protein n=1 Tax=Corynespora cassiicola Philippines TaxID=1448308 RepID=A0A2T2P1D6_CORCC|nr:hypothetical protein BS50DRAFT_584829 [Corynespora cassiicola Philippines]